MSDSRRMKYLNKVEYDTIDLMLGVLKPGKYYKAWAAIMQYAHATETGNLDVPVPVSGDPAVDRFVRVMCNDVRDKTKTYFDKIVPANTRNAEKRWDAEKAKADQADKGKGKSKSKAAKQDKAEGEGVEVRQDAPMTFEAFKEFCGDNININDVRQLYDKLQCMGWAYHGHQLGEYWTKCNECYAKGRGKWCCGMIAIVAYNTSRGYKEPLRAAAFNALCDAMAGAGRGMCDVGDAMSNLKVTDDDEIRYKGKLFNSVQNFSDFLKTSEN